MLCVYTYRGMLFGHWFPPHVPCSAVQGMGSGLLIYTDCLNKYVMPILNGTFLCFRICAHLGTYSKVTTILHFLYAPSIYLFYLIFTILCDDDVVLFVYM